MAGRDRLDIDSIGYVEFLDLGALDTHLDLDLDFGISGMGDLVHRLGTDGSVEMRSTITTARLGGMGAVVYIARIWAVTEARASFDKLDIYDVFCPSTTKCMHRFVTFT